MKPFSVLLDILFPPKCVFCHKILPLGSGPVCGKCLDMLPRTPSHGAQKGQFFSVCVSPLYYEEDVRESLLRFKFNDATGYSKTYGKLLAECIKEYLAGRYDMISWVPLSKKRLRERGYDQARLLSLDVAAELGEESVGTLKKIRHVAKQSTMGSPEKRRANISGAYAAINPQMINGKRILLIDDIITSGSTLGECARTLRQAGAAEVLCATVARSRD